MTQKAGNPIWLAASIPQEAGAAKDPAQRYTIKFDERGIRKNSRISVEAVETFSSR
jgi:hypothetical protein